MSQSTDRFVRLLEARETLGPQYGSEDLCMLLHVLARRERPDVVVELGTGLGVTALWIAAALQDNGHGHLWTVDNGADFTRLDPQELDRAARSLAFERGQDGHSFVRGLLEANGLGDRVTQLDASLDFAVLADGRASWPFLDQTVDWVFSDIRHDPATIEHLLATFLPRAGECFSLFVDSASTHASSFLAAERLIEQLNRSKVPRSFLAVADERRRAELVRAVAERSFSVKHLIETRNRPQNSTMWITAYPTDWRPYPLTMMRGR